MCKAFLGGNKLITALAIDGICGEIEVLVGCAKSRKSLKREGVQPLLRD